MKVHIRSSYPTCDVSRTSSSRRFGTRKTQDLGRKRREADAFCDRLMLFVLDSQKLAHVAVGQNLQLHFPGRLTVFDSLFTWPTVEFLGLSMGHRDLPAKLL